MEVGGGRKRGGPRKRWKDCIVTDDRENLDLEPAQERAIDRGNSSKTATPYRNAIIVVKIVMVIANYKNDVSSSEGSSS